MSEFSTAKVVMENLSEAVKVYRARSGMSLRAVASEIGVTWSTIRRIERGQGCQSEVAVKLLGWLDRMDMESR